ncbi:MULTISPECIES: pyridoxine 5'-phosphate synthase [Agrobacterium]|uniref:Pyridoxine 5'-phosphate synthase n=1 Tax=Agrobacterium rubi TaxID=28099 RepID=A0AAE7R7S9_9HYPH|nr:MULTISPECIES: pyridoxine 5'-phosphate synthase [Agrobacterium]MBN7808917.1 pyridoxine 5'-phosphate synthase [Agrobacterium rosae]NTE90206.1 pyridoxine 5'-phosphate synthase [Agrobacterium rubi]NTF06025.1 pyridoxine 5'-phosphate synthase [Agrobacterium rubi]NTF10555.1 pyridoxine 5'-phosphate synthase [Agrobacterium rubi]NTF22949.1 pyridoxine 5'-phosphate synthase [Agrobacterium rubi]
MTTALSVNLNAIAFLRNRRDLPWPSVEGFGQIALEAGAKGLTVHPRPDQRHIRFSDIPVLRELLDKFPGAEFNIEGYPTEEFLALCIEARADQVTLVPDDPGQATSDRGWDVRKHKALLVETTSELKGRGIRVSVFVDGDGDEEAMDVVSRIGADRIELYTGPYGGCYADEPRAAAIVELLGRTADAAQTVGLGVNAGHDLTVANLPRLIERISHLAEVSIGHDLTADALIHGMAETVRRFRRACGQQL